jgi:hypothetical protein
VDDQEITKLGSHTQVSFKVLPGYHEVSAKLGSLTPTRSLHAEPGQRLYFVLDWEHGDSGMRLSLRPVKSVLSGSTKEEKLSDEELANILSKANPSGADPNKITDQQIPIPSLSDAEVKEAIFQGMHDSTTDGIGFALNDIQTRAINAIVTDGGVTGYTVTVFTAAGWIEFQAAEAHRQLRSYTEAAVTPLMRQDVVLVIASPSVPGKLNAEGMAAASSAEHIVLADDSKKNILQPLREQTAGVSIDSALRSMEYGAVAAVFTKEQFQRVQNKDGEFDIAVTGGYKKFFKIKKNTPIWAMIQERMQ